MSEDIAISVENVSKAYRIWESPAARLISPLQEGLAGMLPDKSALARHQQRQAASRYRDFYALRDVSFTVRRGESFGIIGRNGSGKSTLLQIIAGTLQPTEGKVKVNGRVAALLELGSGFNPDFTGLENVALYSSILGLTQQEMEEKLDSILAFADIGNFVKEPVKTYSSGMLVRLAFSVATHVDADLLLIDEALAVGDVFFQQKCYGRLEALKGKGAAIVLVSHGLNDVEQFCSRALLLLDGKMRSIGPARETVKEYYLVNRAAAIERPLKTQAPAPKATALVVTSWPAPEVFFDISPIKQSSDGIARCLGVGLTDTSGQPCRRFEQGQTACVYYEYELLHDIETAVVGLVIFNRKGVIVHGKNSIEYGSPMPAQMAAGSILRCRQFIRLDLQIDHYTLEVGLASIRNSDLQNASHMTHSELSARIIRHCHLTGLGPFEIGFRSQGQPVQLLHHGIANLEGSVEVIQ